MKKIIGLVVMILMLFSITACGNDDNLPQNSTDEKSNLSSISSEKTDKEESNNTESNDSMNSNTNKKSVYVVKNFFAVEGAVIYDQTYDEYGYPDCCYFHKKCEACGDVSNNNGSARGNMTTGYYCPKCKTSNLVEIRADSDWIEVNE